VPLAGLVGAVATIGAAWLAGISAAISPIANEDPIPAKATRRAEPAAREKCRIQSPLSRHG